MSTYIVVKDNKIVEEIQSDAGADGAYEKKTEEGDLYVKCGPASWEMDPLVPMMEANDGD